MLLHALERYARRLGGAGGLDRGHDDPFGRGGSFFCSSRRSSIQLCSAIDGSKWTATNSVGKLKKLVVIRSNEST